MFEIFDAFERGLKLLNFHGCAVEVQKCLESLSRAEMGAHDPLLVPTNYSKTAGSKLQKADSWQKGVISCQNSKMGQTPSQPVAPDRGGVGGYI